MVSAPKTHPPTPHTNAVLGASGRHQAGKHPCTPYHTPHPRRAKICQDPGRTYTPPRIHSLPNPQPKNPLQTRGQVQLTGKKKKPRIRREKAENASTPPVGWIGQYDREETHIPTNPKFSGLSRPTERKPTTSAGLEVPHEACRDRERCVDCGDISI
jgi:hypothetical protein